MRVPLIILIPIVTTGALIAKNTELATKTAREKNPVLMKILQTVETATSDERLFDVSLKLLKTLCVCMRETLKVKQMDIIGFGGDTNALQVENVEEDSNKRVLELYQNIYNKTCFDLRDDLVGKVKAKTFNDDNGDFMDPNCDKKSVDENTGQYQISSTLLPEIKNDYVQLKDIIFKTFIEMRDNHKFFIKRYNLFSTPSKFSLDRSKHSIIVLLTLNSVNEISKINNSTEIKSDELDTILKSQSRVDIDFIDARYGSKENNSFESLIPKAASNCTLKSIYIFVLQNAIEKNIKVFKLLRKKNSIKVYIDIPTEIHHVDYSRICCDDDTKLHYCKIDSKKIDSQKVTTPQPRVKKRKKTGNYKDTISKIKTLVKLYDKKIKNSKLDTLHMEPQNLTNTDFIHVITEPDNNLKLTEENYHNSAVLPTDYNINHSTLRNVVNTVKELHKTIKVPDKSSVTAEKYFNDEIMYRTTDGMKNLNNFEKTLAPNKNIKTALDIAKFTNKKPFNQKQTEINTTSSRHTYSTNSNNTEDYTYAKLLDTVPDISRNDYKVSAKLNFLNTAIHRPRSTKNKYEEPISTHNVERQNEKYTTHFNQIFQQPNGNGYLQELNKSYVNIVNETPSMKPMEASYFGPNTLLKTNLIATAENIKTVRSSTSNQHNTEGYTNTQYLNTKPNIMGNKTLSDVVNYPINTINSTSKYIEPLNVPVLTQEMENQNDKYTLYSINNLQPIDSYLQVLNTTDINNVSETRSVILTEENNVTPKSSTYPTKNCKENMIEKITTLPMAFIRQNNLKLPVNTSANNNYTSEIPIQITNNDLHIDYFITSKSTNKEAKQSRGSVEKPEISKSVIPRTFSNHLEQSMAMEQSENYFQQDGNSLTTVTDIRNKVSDPATQVNPWTNNIDGDNIIHTLKNYQTSSIPPATTNAITFKTFQEKRTKVNGINFKPTILSQTSHKEDKNNKNLELIENVVTGKNDKHYYVTESAFIESPYEVDNFTNANNDYTKKDIIKPNKSLEQTKHVFEYKTISMTKTNMLNEHYSKKMSVSPNTTITTKAINNNNTLITILLPFNYDFNSESHTLTESFKPRVLDVSSQNKDVINQNVQNVTTTIKKEYSGNHDILTLFKKDNDFQQYHESINNSEKHIPNESKHMLETRTVRGITDNFLSQTNIPTISVEIFTNNKDDFVTENYGSKQVTDLHSTGYEQVNTNYVSFLENDNISNSTISPTKTTTTFEQSTDIDKERENNRAFTTTDSYTINAHESYTTKTKNTEVKKDFHKDQSTKNPSFNYSTLNSRTELMKATTENDHNNTVESVIKSSVSEVLNRNLFRYLATAQDTLSKNMLKKPNEVTSTYQVERNNTGDDMIVKEIGKTNNHYITTDTDIDIKYQIDNSSTTPGLNNSDLSSKPKVTPKYEKLQLREYKQSDTRLQESVTKDSVTTELGTQNEPPSTLLTKMSKNTKQVTSSYQVEHNDIDDMVVKKNYSHHLSNVQQSNTVITTNTDIEKAFQNGKSSNPPSVSESSTSEFTEAMTTSDSMKYKMFKVRDSEKSNIKENVTKGSAVEELSSKNQTTSLQYSSTTRNQHFNKNIQKDANEDALSNHFGHNNIGSMISSSFEGTKSHHLSGELISISLIPWTDNSKATTEVLPLRENINTESRPSLESTHNIVAFTDDIVTNNNFISKASLKFIPLKEPIKVKGKKISENMEKNHSHFIPEINKVHPMNITSLLTHENYNENIQERTNVENIFLELKSVKTAEPNVMKENLIQSDNYENSTVNFINKKPSESEEHLNLNKDNNSSQSHDGRSHSIDMNIMESGMAITNFTSNTESYYNSITNTDYMSTSKMGIQINNQTPITAENKENAVIEKEGNIEQNSIITTSKLPSKLDEIVSELKSMISVEPISINEIEPFKIVENENVIFDLNEINAELDMVLLTPEIYNYTQNSNGKLSPTIVTIEPKSVISTGALIERPSSKPELYKITKKVVTNTNNTAYFEEDRTDIHSTTNYFETPDDLKVLQMLNRIKSSFHDNRADTNITDDRFKQEGTVIHSTTNIPNPPDDHDDLNDNQSDNVDNTNTPSTPDDLKFLQMFNTSKSSFHDDQVDTHGTDNLKENMPVFPRISNSPNAQDDLKVSQMLNRIKTSFYDDLNDTQSSENLEENMKVITSSTNSPSTPDDFRELRMLETIKSSFRDDRGGSQSTNNFKEDITVIPIKETSPNTPDDLKVLQTLNTNKSSFHDDRADFHSTDNFKGKKTVLPDTSNIPNIQDDSNSFRDARDDARSTDHFKEDLTVIPSITNSPNTPDDLRVLQMLNRIKTSFHDDLNDTKSREHLEEDMTAIPNSTNPTSKPDDFKILQMFNTNKSSFHDDLGDSQSTNQFKEDITVIPIAETSPNTSGDLKVLQMLNTIKSSFHDDRDKTIPDYLKVLQISETIKSSFLDDRSDSQSSDKFKEDKSVIPNTTNIPNIPDELKVLQMLNRIKTSFHDDLNDTKSNENIEDNMTVIPCSTNLLSTSGDLKVVQTLKTIKSSIGDDPAEFHSTHHFKEDLKVITKEINTPNMQDDLQVWQMMNKIKNSFLDDRTDIDTTESNLLDNTSPALYKFTKPQNNTLLIDEKLQKPNKSIEKKGYDSKFDLTQTTTLSGNFILGQPTKTHSESTETSSRVVENTETYKESLKLDSNILSNILKEESKSTLKSYSAEVATQFGQLELTTISPIEKIIHDPSTICIYLKNKELHKTRGKDKITDIPVEETSNFKARAKTDSNVNSKTLSIFTTETLPNILKAVDNYDTSEIPQKYTDYSTQVIAINNSPFHSNLNINNESTNNIFDATISELDKTLHLNNIYNGVNTYRNLPYRSNDNSVTRQQPNLIEDNEIQSLANKIKFPTKSNLNAGSTPSLQIVTNEDKNENTQPTRQLIKDNAGSTEPINELQTSTDNIINVFLKEDVEVPMSNTKPEITEAFQSKPYSLYISDLSPLYVQNNLQNREQMNDGMIKNTATLNVQNNANCTETPMNFDDDVMTQKIGKNLTFIIIGNIHNKETPSTHHVLSREVTKVLGENVNSRYTKISKGTNGAHNKNKLFTEANLPSTNSRIMKTDNNIFDEKSNSRDETSELFSTASVLDVRDNFEETFDLTSKSPNVDLKYMNDSNVAMNKNYIESKIKDTSLINKWSSVEVNEKIEILNNNSSLLDSLIMTTLDKNTNLVEIGTISIVNVNDGMDFPNITPKISSIYEINNTVKGLFPREPNFTISGTEDFSKNKSITNARPKKYIEQSKIKFKNVTYNKDNNSSTSDITTESVVTIFENKLSAEHDVDLQSKKIVLSLNSEKSNLTIDRTTSLEYNKITTIKQSVTSLETNNHFDMMNNNLLATGTDIATKFNDGTLTDTSSSTENVLNEFNEQVKLNKTFSPLNILNQFLTRSDQNADTNTTIPKSEAITTINKSIDFVSKLRTNVNDDTQLSKNSSENNILSEIEYKANYSINIPTNSGNKTYSTITGLPEKNTPYELSDKITSPLDIFDEYLTRFVEYTDTKHDMLPKMEAATVNTNFITNLDYDMTTPNEDKIAASNIDSELKSNQDYSNKMNITVFDKNIPNLTDIQSTKGTSNLNINSVLPVYVENINGTLNTVPKQTTNVNYYSKFIDSTVRSEIRSSSEMKNMTNYIFLTNDPGNKVYKDTYFNKSALPDGNTPYQFSYNAKVNITEIFVRTNHTKTDGVKDIDLSTLVLPKNEVLIQNHNRKPSLHSQQSTTKYSTTELYSNTPSKKCINENFKRTTKEYNNKFSNTLNFTTKDTKNIDPSSSSLTPNEITKFKHKTEYDKIKTIQEATDTAKAVKTEVYKDFFFDKNDMGTAKDTSTKISFNVTMLSELNLSNELISDTSGTDQEYSNVHDNKPSRTDLLDTTKESTATGNGLRNADAHIEFEQLTTSTNNFILYGTPVMKRNDVGKIFPTTKTEDPERSYADNVAWQVNGIGAQLNTSAIGDGFIPEFTSEIINVTDNMKKEASFSKDTIFTKLDSETYENYIKDLKNTSTETSISKIKTVIHDLVTPSNIDEPFELTNDSTSKDYTNINITLNPNNTLSTELTIKDSNYTTSHFEIVSDTRTSIDTSLPFSEDKLSIVNKSNTNITEITSKNEHRAINDSYMKSTSPKSNENNVNTVMLTQTEQRINTVLLEATNSRKKIKATLDDIHYGNKDTTNDVHADIHNEHNKATDHTPGNLILNESYSFGQSSSEKPKKIIELKMEETENTERTMDRHLKTGFNKNENNLFSVLDTIIDNRLVTLSTMNEINNQHFENNEPKLNMSNSQSFFVEHKFTNINDTFLNVTDLTAQNDNVNTSYQLNQALPTIISNNDTFFNVYPIPALSTYNSPINPNDSIGNQLYNIDQHAIIQGNYEHTTKDRINKNDYTTTRSAPFLVNYNKNTKNEYVIRVKKINRPESIKTTIGYQTINKVNPDISSLDNNIETKNIPANTQKSTKALSDAIIQTEHLIPTSITITSTEKMNPVVKYLKDSKSELSKLNVIKNHRLERFKQSDHFKTTKNISNVRGERQNQGTFVKVCVNKDKCNTTTPISKHQNEYKLKNRLDHSSENSKNKKQIFNHSKLIKKTEFKGVHKGITHTNTSITTNVSLNNVKKLKGKTNFEKTDSQTLNNIDKMSSRRQVSKLNMSNLFQSKDVHVTTYLLTKTTKEIVYNTYRPTTEEEIDPPTLDKILSTLPILTKNLRKERHEFKHNMKHVIHNNKVKNEIQIQSKIQNNGANEDKRSNSGEKTRLYPVINHQKLQKTVMKKINVGNRKSDIIQMNTEDFFSRRRAIERGDKLYNILRLHPKSEKIHQVTKLPRQVILRPIFKTIKSYKNTILNVKPVIIQETDHDFYREMQPRSPLKQDKPQPSIGFRDPVLEKPYYMPAKARPIFLRDKVDAIRSFIYNSELSPPRKHFLNPPSNLIRDYADPLIYDSEGNWRDEEVSSSPSPMTRPKKTIFFLSPTVPYNRYF